LQINVALCLNVNPVYETEVFGKELGGPQTMGEQTGEVELKDPELK